MMPAIKELDSLPEVHRFVDQWFFENGRRVRRPVMQSFSPVLDNGNRVAWTDKQNVRWEAVIHDGVKKKLRVS